MLIKVPFKVFLTSAAIYVAGYSSVPTAQASVSRRRGQRQDRIGGGEHHPEKNERELQAAYTASYVGQYQLIQDVLCSGAPSPTVLAMCTGSITVTGTSDPSITCEPISSVTSGFLGVDAVACQSSCASDEVCASEIYLVESIDVDGPLGEVYFDCSGPDLEDIQARFSFEPGTGAICVEGDPNSQALFHLARLGIDCESNEDGNEDGDGLTFTHNYFECLSGSFGVSLEEGLAVPAHPLSCLAIDSVCDGSDCITSHERVIVETDVQYLPATCIATSLPVATAPQATVLDEDFQYAVRFSASWGVGFVGLFDSGPGEGSGSCVSPDVATIMIECLKESEITLESTLFDTTICDKSAPNVLECTDNGDRTEIFASVEYTCIGRHLPPETRVEYPPADVTCENVVLGEDVTHLVQLGVYCDQEYFYGDAYFECGEGNEFTTLDEAAAFGARYTCAEVVSVPSFTTEATVYSLPTVAIRTESTWSSNPLSVCYERMAASSNDAIGSSPSPSPTVIPTPLVSSPPAASSPTVPSSQAEIESPYRVSYAGRFWQYVAPICSAENPIFYALCPGDIRITGTSDDRIVCTKLNKGQILPDQAAARCEISCDNEACAQDLFRTNSVLSQDRNVEVYFDCFGDRIEEAAGSLLLGAVDGDCAAGDDQSVFHFLELGVMCESELYSFNHNYVDCTENDIGLSLENGLTELGRDLTCATAAGLCDGVACSLTVRQLTIHADVEYLPESCIDSDIAVTAAPSPTVSEGSSFEFVVQFQTSWALQIESLNCESSYPTINIQCLSGSTIQLVSTSRGSTSCEAETSNVLECRDLTPTFLNEFTSVTYECVGPDLPQTHVSLSSVTATCETLRRQAEVTSLLQVGVFCLDDDDDEFNFDDHFFECGAGNQFTTLDETGEGYGFRLTCGESVLFTSSSTPSEQSVLAVTVETDPSWQESLRSECYSRREKRQPTIEPSSVPTSSPVQQKLASTTATAAPSVTTGTSPSEPLTPSSSSATTVLISVVAVLAVLMIGVAVGGICWWCRSRRGTDGDGKPPVRQVQTGGDSSSYGSSAGTPLHFQQPPPLTVSPPTTPHTQYSSGDEYFGYGGASPTLRAPPPYHSNYRGPPPQSPEFAPAEVLGVAMDQNEMGRTDPVHFKDQSRSFVAGEPPSSDPEHLEPRPRTPVEPMNRKPPAKEPRDTNQDPTSDSPEGNRPYVYPSASSTNTSQEEPSGIFFSV